MFEVGDIVKCEDGIGELAYIFHNTAKGNVLLHALDDIRTFLLSSLKLYSDLHEFHLGDRVYFWDDRGFRHVGVIDRCGTKMPKCTVYADDGFRLVREIRKIVHETVPKESYQKKWKFL